MIPSWLHLSNGTACLLAIAIISCVAAGCASAERSTARGSASVDTAEVKPISNTDPCAMQLHDLEGALLFYYFNRGRLPAELSDLADLEGGLPVPEFVCPEAQAAYVYNPDGIYLAEQGTYVVLYDPAPVHAGMRWAITVREPDEAGTLVAKVVALPERFFALRPPAARGPVP